MKIILPFKTPTTNHLYGYRGHFQYKKKDAKILEQQIEDIVKPMPHDDIATEEMLEVIAEIYEDWYFQNGKMITKDVANREKFLVDSVFRALGINDKHIWKITLKKMQSNEEYAVIQILPYQSESLQTV